MFLYDMKSKIRVFKEKDNLGLLKYSEVSGEICSSGSGIGVSGPIF